MSPTPDRLLPPYLVDRARDYLHSGGPPVDPRSAATVALLRDGPNGIEVYLLRRVQTMAFAPGMHVFPGGTVDPRDSGADISWTGPDLDSWSSRLRQPGSVTRALACAAVRETFEESGVLLAGRDPETLVPDTIGDDWETARLALVDRSLAFSDLLRSRDLVVRGDLLRLWARWVTPEFEPRRYDTVFFVAALPSGQRPRDIAGEADRAVWMRPQAALEALARGEVTMLPPTAAVLGELAACSTVTEVLAVADGRVVDAITPRPVLDAATPYVVLPGERGYDP